MEFKVYSVSAVSNIPLFIIWGLIAIFGIGFFVLIWRKGWRRGLRAGFVLLLVEWVFLILCSAVIFREAHATRHFNLIPLWSYFNYDEKSYLIEMVAINVLNVLMFVPFGLLLGCGFGKTTWQNVIAAGVGLSVLIELLQFIFKRGLCETDDVLHNVIGCMIGYSIFRFLLRLIKHVQTFF